MTGAPAGSEPARRPAQPPAERALDQWRGLALLLVLVSHAWDHTGRVPGVGRVGVNLFFFISGILVQRSLARAPATGAVALARDFIHRRARRLVPANWFYLAAMTVAVLLAVPAFQPPEFRTQFLRGLPGGLLYFKNYALGTHIADENLTGHLWSVACEMQFYLLAPGIFLLGGRSTGRRLTVWGLLLLGLAAGGASVMFKPALDETKYAFGVAAWPMMAGFFAEYLRTDFPATYRRIGGLLLAAGLLSLALIPAALLGGQKKLIVLAGLGLIPGCLGSYLRGRDLPGPVGSALHWLGNRTYSIYLWQQPLTIGGFVPEVWRPLGALCALPLGAVSFRFLEKPFMSKFRGSKAAPPVATAARPA